MLAEDVIRDGTVLASLLPEMFQAGPNPFLFGEGLAKASPEPRASWDQLCGSLDGEKIKTGGAIGFARLSGGTAENGSDAR
jgi:hypothetical protein